MPTRFRLRPWMLVSAAWIAPAVLGAINTVAQRRIWDDPPATLNEVLFVGLDWLIYAFLTPAIFPIARRWPLSRPRLVSHTLIHLGCSLLFCAAWATGGTALKVVLSQVDNGVAVAFVSWFFTTLPFGVAVYFAVVGIEHAARYFVEARDRDVQLARMSEQLSGARFAALQAQLNPHFLFNTLNTIAVLVRDGDRTGAARMVEQLSDVLRRTLTRDRANEVTLEDELELVRQYVAIEQARYSDRLRIAFAIDDAALSAAVPSFAVQHLVENAIRHGTAKRPGAGQVQVAARRDGGVVKIVVTDDGVGFDTQAAAPKGHGIENTRERLQVLYGEHASLVVTAAPTGGTIATLRLPYRELLLESDVGG